MITAISLSAARTEVTGSWLPTKRFSQPPVDARHVVVGTSISYCERERLRPMVGPVLKVVDLQCHADCLDRDRLPFPRSPQRVGWRPTLRGKDDPPINLTTDGELQIV